MALIIGVMGVLTLLLVGGGVTLILAHRAGDKERSALSTADSGGTSFSGAGQDGVFPELAATTPFPAHLRPSPQHPPGVANGGCTMIFGLIWTAFSAIFVIFPLVTFGQEWGNFALLKRSGITIEAVVVDRRVDEDSDGDSYYVTYQFTAPAGKGDRQNFSREQGVMRRRYDELPPQSRVDIIYAPSDPTVSTLASKFGPPFGLLFMAGMGGLFVLIGLALLGNSWRTMGQASQLNRQGQLIQGTVLDGWTDTDSDGDRVYCVAYHFTPPGRPGVTRAEYNRTAYNRLAPGDPVSVRYLPQNPHICRLEL